MVIRFHCIYLKNDVTLYDVNIYIILKMIFTAT